MKREQVAEDRPGLPPGPEIDRDGQQERDVRQSPALPQLGHGLAHDGKPPRDLARAPLRAIRRVALHEGVTAEAARAGRRHLRSRRHRRDRSERAQFAGIAFVEKGHRFGVCQQLVQVQGEFVESAVLATGEIHSLVKCENEVTLSDSGLYRFDVIHLPGLNQKLCGFKVYEGAAAVQLASVISVLTRGKATTLSLACGDHVGLWTFDLEQADALDNWSRQQIRLRRAQ